MTATVKPHAGQLLRVGASMVCLACGELSHTIVADAASLPRLPLRCSRCGGSVIAEEIGYLLIADPSFNVDMRGEAPRRGRPPGTKSRLSATNGQARGSK